MNLRDFIPLLLLLLFAVGVGTIAAVALFVVRLLKHRRVTAQTDSWTVSSILESPAAFSFSRRPTCWLAIKSENLLTVQAALGLHKPRRCSWAEALEQKLFIAPPVRGWVLVMGSGLPDPGEDIDVCHRFVLDLSAKLGQVQFFSASSLLNHHAWIKAEGGRVLRAYAWAGQTVWQQGNRTTAEKELGLKCFDYDENVAPFEQPEVLVANVDKVPLLAARWSVDPIRIETLLEPGIAGEPSY